MTIFKHKETGVLYRLFYVTPMKFTGSWYDAEVYNRPSENYPPMRQLSREDCHRLFEEVASR